MTPQDRAQLRELAHTVAERGYAEPTEGYYLARLVVKLLTEQEQASKDRPVQDQS